MTRINVAKGEGIGPKIMKKILKTILKAPISKHNEVLQK